MSSRQIPTSRYSDTEIAAYIAGRDCLTCRRISNARRSAGLAFEVGDDVVTGLNERAPVTV